MATAIDIMKGGFSAASAKAINGTANGAVSAGTTQTQAGATALTASVNAVTTVTTAGDGVRLPSGEIGDEMDIVNLTANYCKVYPPTGERIGSLAANTAFDLPAQAAVKVKKFTSTRWMGFLSA